MTEALTHIPVLLDEILHQLAPSPQRTSSYCIYDGTLGGAGHTRALLQSNPNVFVIGVDRDATVLQRTREALTEYASRVHLIHGCFSEIAGHLNQLPKQWAQHFKGDPVQCDAMLVDLGVSSFQLDDGSRGFSFRHDAPLDMRMDTSQALSAQSVVNDYSPQALKRVLQRGGVAADSFRLAKAIVDNRPVRSTAALAAICESALNRRSSHSHGKKNRHPATIVFQAIRIEVNDEFGEIERFLEAVPEHLAPGGKVAIISFHSTEDKLVAKRMRAWSRAKKPLKELALADTPALGSLVTPQAIIPTEIEISKNPRARSARLRVFQRTQAEDAKNQVRKIGS